MNIYRIAAVCLILFIAPAWGADFRNANWGATPGEIELQEKGKSLDREETKDGNFALVFSETIFGQTAKVSYFFDASCEQLYAGSISFEESVSEGTMLGIIRTFSSIYGESEPSGFVHGGVLSTWEAGESSIQFRHLPSGMELPEIAHWPRSAINYYYRDRKTKACR